MLRFASIVATICALGGVGCSGQVSRSSGGGGGTASSTGANAVGATGPSSGSGGPTANAVVTTDQSKFDPDTSPCIQNPYPDGTVFVIAASSPISCDVPEPADFLQQTCEVDPFTWELCFALAPSKLAAGTSITYDLDSVDANEADEGGDPDTCTGGYVSLQQGALAITSVAASSVGFKLTDLDFSAGDGEVNANGAYVAIRCP